MKSTVIKKTILSFRNPEQAKILTRFFKTKKGEYGEGDKFLGIKVPILRKITKEFQDIEFKELDELITDKFHEYRFVALQILVLKYNSAKDPKFKEQIVNYYLKRKKYINNWDLVDSSVSYILGNWLLNKKDRSILYKLAKSENLWDRRIAIISTFAFIKNHDFTDTIKISTILLADKEDLIHKAIGWMLREVGKKSKLVLIDFLNKNVKTMPRTTLRYAIERFEEKERRKYLQMN